MTEVKLHQVSVDDMKLTVYDPVVMLKFAIRVAKGDLLDDIYADPTMPSRVVMQSWIVAHPEADAAFKAAREMSALAFEEEAIKKLRELAKAPGTPQKVSATRALTEQLRWSAERRNPKTFGAQAATKVVVPIHISTPLNLDPNKITAGAGQTESIYDIQATVVKDAPTAPDEAPAPVKPLVPIDMLRAPGRPVGPVKVQHREGFDQTTEEEREAAYQAYLDDPERAANRKAELKREKDRKRMQEMRDKVRAAGGNPNAMSYKEMREWLATQS